MANPNSQIIEALTFSNRRCEFRLDPDRQYTNLRLVNLGCIITGTNEYMQYIDSVGVYGLIENIYLYNGTDVIDQLLSANQFLSFSNLLQTGTNKDNGLDYSLYSNLTLSSRSYELSPKNDSKISHVDTRDLLATKLEASTAKGWLNLNRVFNFLTRVPGLDTSMMQNLRVVIEWQTTPQSIFMGDTSNVTGVNVLQPLLLADMVLPENAFSMPKQVMFMRYELERITLPSGVQPSQGSQTPQSVRVRVLNFQGHIVNRLLMINQDQSKLLSNDNDDRLKGFSSEALPDELIQLEINGATLLPYTGVDTPARATAHLFNSFGTLNTVVGSNIEAYDLAGTNKYEALYDNELGYMVGKQAYFGVNVNQRCQEINLQVERKLTYNKFGQIIKCLWGEVAMVLTMGSNQNQYTISYM